MGKFRDKIGDLLSGLDPRMQCTDAHHDDRDMWLHFGGRFGNVDHVCLAKSYFNGEELAPLPGSQVEICAKHFNENVARFILASPTYRYAVDMLEAANLTVKSEND